MSRRFSKLVKGASGFLAVAVLAASCGTSDTSNASNQQDELPTIAVTTSIWGDVISNATCDGLVDVNVIIPPGADPHSFELSLADRELLDNSDLIVANGLALEEGLVDTLETVEADGKKIFEFADHVEILEYEGEGHHDDEHDDEHGDEKDHGEEKHGDDKEHSDEEKHDEDEEHSDEGKDEHSDEEGHDEHNHEGGDPHVWFNPIGVSEALSEFEKVAVEELGLDSEKINECITAYQGELQSLDGEIKELFAAIPVEERKLVTAHDAFGYFADQYELEIVGVVLPSLSTLGETNPAELQELSDKIVENDVSTIFSEFQSSDEEASALAEELDGVELVTLYTGSLGEEGSGADTYITMLRTDAQLLADSLS